MMFNENLIALVNYNATHAKGSIFKYGKSLNFSDNVSVAFILEK